MSLGGKIPHYQLEENFTHDQHGAPTGAIFAEGIDNLRLKPSRSAAAKRSTSLPVHSRNVQLSQSIDDARRAPVGALHHRLDLRAGARRVEPKSHLLALRQKVRVRHGRGERLA